MTTDGVTTMRNLFDAWNRGDLAAGISTLDEFVVWDARKILVPELQRVYHGPAGVREFWQQWLPMWDRITVEVRWIEGGTERVRAWLRQTQVGQQSGAEVTSEYGWDVTFRDDKIIRVSFFTDEQDGRRAAQASV